jgi:hypothetical protein
VVAVSLVSIAEFEELRKRRPSALLVAPGHWSPGHERVVHEDGRYQLVEARAARRDPPRRYAAPPSG